MSNIAFTALIKNKGYNKQRLGEECGLSRTQMSNRINGANDWRWAEVSRICAALDITYDEFAAYFPASYTVKENSRPKEPTKRELAVDAIKAFLEYLEQEA